MCEEGGCGVSCVVCVGGGGKGRGTWWDKQHGLVILPSCEHVYLCAYTHLLVCTHQLPVSPNRLPNLCFGLRGNVVQCFILKGA